MRFEKLQTLFFATLFVAGCNPPPQVCPPAAGVAPAVVTAAPQANPSPSNAAPSPGTAENRVPTASASGGFSLPIGADIPPTADAPSKAPLTVPPLAQQPQPNPSGQNPPQVPQQPPQSPPATAAAGSSAPASAPSVQLSAGIAVPQSLPVGTVMALSVDYSFRAEPRASPYLWVVKSAAGEIVNEVKLESSGNLSAFFQKLRPEHRPFSVRIEEVTPGSKRRRVISNELTLKTDY